MYNNDLKAGDKILFTNKLNNEEIDTGIIVFEENKLYVIPDKTKGILLGFDYISNYYKL